MSKKLFLLITLLIVFSITPAFSYWMLVYAHTSEGTHAEGYTDASFESLIQAIRDGKNIRVYIDGSKREREYYPVCVYYDKESDFIAARNEFPWLDETIARYCYLELRTNGQYILYYCNLDNPAKIYQSITTAPMKWFVEE